MHAVAVAYRCWIRLFNGHSASSAFTTANQKWKKQKVQFNNFMQARTQLGNYIILGKFMFKYGSDLHMQFEARHHHNSPLLLWSRETIKATRHHKSLVVFESRPTRPHWTFRIGTHLCFNSFSFMHFTGHLSGCHFMAVQKTERADRLIACKKIDQWNTSNVDDLKLFREKNSYRVRLRIFHRPMQFDMKSSMAASAFHALPRFPVFHRK